MTTKHWSIEGRMELYLEANKALAQPDVKARLATMGCDPAPGTAESFAARIQSDVTRWKKLAAEKQIRAD